MFAQGRQSLKHHGQTLKEMHKDANSPENSTFSRESKEKSGNFDAIKIHASTSLSQIARFFVAQKSVTKERGFHFSFWTVNNRLFDGWIMHLCNNT